MFETLTKRREPHFGYLLVALILFLIFGPLARILLGEADGLVLMITLNTTLVIGIFSLQENRALFRSGLIMAAISVSITVLDFFFFGTSLTLLNIAVLLAFLVLSVAVALRNLIQPGGISFNRIMGGACIYIMLGIIWAILYAFIDWGYPGAFSGAITPTGVDPMSEGGSIFWDLIYFSFVTMPALGYGDITPVAPIARVFAYLQAVVGQLFIAILIGSLVGAYVSSSRAGKEKID